MTGAPEGSPKVVLCGFVEKPGIEPATPGLQGIALIHYTTGASWDTAKTTKRINNAQFRNLLLDLSNIYIFYYFIEGDLPSFQIHNK